MTIAPAPGDVSVRDSPAAANHYSRFGRWIDGWLRPGRRWVGASLAIYVLACALPAMPPFMGSDPIYGYECLLVGLELIAFPPWWANPAYFVAVGAALWNRHRLAVVFAVVAAVLANSYELIGFYNQGVSETLAELLPGCLLWVASLQLLACHELWRQWLAWRQRQLDQDLGRIEAPASTT